MSKIKTKRNRRDPMCYFTCEDCGAIQTAPTSDVKQVGHPVCPDECGNEEMTEITYNEYRAQKKLIDTKPFKDIYGERYSDKVKYYQPHELGSGPLKDHTGYEWPSYAVWLNKDTCTALFPNYQIDEYSGEDIQEPGFVDKPDNFEELP